MRVLWPGSVDGELSEAGSKLSHSPLGLWVALQDLLTCAMFWVARAVEFYASLNGHGTLMKQEVVVTLIPEGAHIS